MSDANDMLRALGLTLPRPAAPAANYCPTVRSGQLLYISGQLSNDADGGVRGRVGADVDLATAQRAARICGVNLLAQVSAACDGDLNRVERVMRLGGFVQAAADFTDISAVVNGCSDLMAEVFGARGLHARSAIGVYALPFGFAVEVEALVLLKD